jgi:beta-lactamase regulating signal transducer with metallopeptidase domain
MSFLIDSYLPALLFSSAALVALKTLQETSVRFRATLALLGVLAWFLPWQLVTIPAFSQPTLPLKQLIDTTALSFQTGAAMPVGPATETQATVPTGPWWLLLFVPGALLFVFDLHRRSRQLESLQRQSRDGEGLRALLPDSLRTIPGRICIIPGSNAMATGVRRGTIWVGEELCAHRELEAALVHECCHLRRKDTVLILAVNLARRLYCWNPIVALLSRRLLLLIEQACDADAAAVLGKTSYLRSLTRLMLDTSASGMAMVPMVLGGSNDYRRIRALESGSATVLRRCTAGVLVLAAGVLALSVNAQQRDPRIGEWREDYYPPNSVGLYMIYEELGNGMTRVHSAENLAQQNRLHQDIRCDGRFYPYLDARGVPNGISTTCTVVDANTVTVKLIRDTAQGREEGEGAWALSKDGNHYSTVTVWKDREGKVGPANERRFTRNSENCLNHAQDERFRECAKRSRPPR